MNRFVTLLAVPAVLAAAASADVVLNGGFESGSAGDADNWFETPIFGGGATASVERADDSPFGGAWHMSLTVAGAADFGPVAVLQQQTALDSVAPGDIVSFDVMARRNGALGPGVVVFLEVQWLDSDGSNGGGVKGSTGLLEIGGGLTDTYQSFGFADAVVAADADAALINISLVGGAFDGSDGAAYFDNASLVVVPAPGVPALLVLGGVLRRRPRRA
ncbi:MAG: hypothetical protein ACF8LK_00405 [Phycisphaerales bacterium JB041]